MTKSSIKLLSTSLLLLSGCSFIPLNSNFSIKENKKGSNEVVFKETIEITISCNKEKIQSYLEKGWEIENSIVSEVPCTWRTTKANKKCNPKRDKGCLISVPDIMGTKTIYQLSRNKQLSEDSE